ncbi:MAG: DUF192 domain-containing protein [Cyanobacteria bacterium P01_F01_bin.150]
MTQFQRYFLSRPKLETIPLPYLISLFIGISLLGCGYPSSSFTAETQPTSLSTVEVPVSAAAISSSEPKSEAVSSLAQQLPLTAMTTINGTSIYLEVAQTPLQQSIGLMYRSSLHDEKGMLFPFSPPRPVNFWMRNVEIDLDMLFIQDGQVLAIEAEAPPCRTAICPHYGPEGVPVDYVLELRGGRAAELGIELGDPIVITELPDAL